MTEAQLAHPQPLGAFGVPAGMLLVRSGPGIREACDELVAGRLPLEWPAALEAHRLAHEDRLDEALAALRGDDIIDRYNRWVIDSQAADPDQLRALLPASVAPIVDVVRHLRGEGPAPDVAILTDETSDEVRALALAASAADTLAAGDIRGATGILDKAADLAGHSAARGVLRASAAALAHDGGDPEAATILQQAADELSETGLDDLRAELSLRLGSLAQERSARGEGDARQHLRQAMSHYYAGLQRVTEQSDPWLWASLNMNLATAQLAVPMNEATDQLRLGVAGQALRAALRVFSASEHPAQWATATINLANALVYTPSTHQRDNLAEAVGLYEQVLESGVRDGEPVGRARLLTNQGNALAHLGAFAEARSVLAEARYVFETHLDHDGTATVRGILDEIAKEQVADPDRELGSLARQAEQMSRMPLTDGPYTAGMGVTIGAPDAVPPPKPKVVVLDKASRPTQEER